MNNINLTGQTTVQYEVEALVNRYGSCDWERTAHGYFDNLDEARRTAAGMTQTPTRIARVEVVRSVVDAGWLDAIDILTEAGI